MHLFPKIGIMGQVQPIRTERKFRPPIIVSEFGKRISFPQFLEKRSVIGKSIIKQYGSLEEFQDYIDLFLKTKLGRNVNKRDTGYVLCYDLVTSKFFISNTVRCKDDTQMIYSNKEHPMSIVITEVFTNTINKSGRWKEIDIYFRVIITYYEKNKNKKNLRIDRIGVHRAIDKYISQYYDYLIKLSKQHNPEVWSAWELRNL